MSASDKESPIDFSARLKRMEDRKSGYKEQADPESGLAPNPDNSTKLPIDEMPWFMGQVVHVETVQGRRSFRIAADPQTGLAKWPLSFEEIEDDFVRPNKPNGLEVKEKDSQKPDTKDKPFQTGLPI